jgi:acetoin utilization protein AcuB
MTQNPRTVGMDAPLDDAVEALQSLEVRHLPVVNAQGELVGMLSDRDLGALARLFTEGSDAQHLMLTRARVPVARVMSSDVADADTESTLAEIVETRLPRSRAWATSVRSF